MKKVIIIGAGLAGCEAALTLARHGVNVILYEQKPQYYSHAHKDPDFCELVCSNSFRSKALNSGIGLLKQEMLLLESSVINAAIKSELPADKALAVDRKLFSSLITRNILANPLIQVEHLRIDSLDDDFLEQEDVPVILAAGPMISANLAESLIKITGQGNCYFYDAIAPIVWTDSLDFTKVFQQSRYDRDGMGDYLNCPMNKEEYENFYKELTKAKIWQGHEEDTVTHFEGCMPIEALAERGIRTLLFGPLKPVGLIDPKTGHRPWAVLQLRPENSNKTACNMVGCQTKLLQGEQERIFRMVPGMENVEFVRYGSMHRNTYINAPLVLNSDLSLKQKNNIYIAGQLSGVEGYIESAASGLWAALYLIAKSKGHTLSLPPVETALGALLAHLQRKDNNFQPSNVNFGLMPDLGYKIHKSERKEAYAQRATIMFTEWLKEVATIKAIALCH